MHEHDSLAAGFKALLDILSVGIVMGTLASILPPAAALLTVVYTVIRIYETRTVQGWLKRGGGNGGAGSGGGQE